MTSPSSPRLIGPGTMDHEDQRIPDHALQFLEMESLSWVGMDPLSFPPMPQAEPPRIDALPVSSWRRVSVPPCTEVTGLRWKELVLSD
ncbi:hypothetical protein GN956_G10799 [Arapaima gigas]